MTYKFISAINHPESPLSASTIPNMIKRTKELELDYMAFADQGHMMSSLKCYMESTKKGIKPILGVELYFKDSNCDIIKGTKSELSKYFTITVFAKDQEAYQELVKISSRRVGKQVIIAEKSYPLTSWDDLKYLSTLNTIAVTGGPNCIIAKHSLVGRGDLSFKVHDKLHGIFKDNLYLAITPIEISHEWKSMVSIEIDGKKVEVPANSRVDTDYISRAKFSELARSTRHSYIKNIYINKIKFKVNKKFSKARLHNEFVPLKSGDILLKINQLLNFIAEKNNILDKLIISTYSYYAHKEDKIVQDMKLGELKRLHPNYHMMDSEDIAKYLAEKMKFNESKINAIAFNSQQWAEKFKDFSLSYKYRLPSSDEDPFQKTIKMIKQNGRMKWDDTRYTERLKIELETLKDNGKLDLLPYFFPIAEVFDFYKKNNRLVGPARGSAGGCLVAYLMGITQIDPIKYNLSFSRFISSTRILKGAFPDIDCDIPDKTLLLGKDGNGGFLNQRWPNMIAQVSTRGMMRLKSSIKDVNRFINKGSVEERIEVLSKGLPMSPQGISDADFVFGYEQDEEHIQGLIETSTDLQDYAVSRPNEWDIVQKSLGVVRQPGRHASAVIIANEPIENVIPVMEVGGVKRVTQPEAKQCEFAGLIKYDFLGLKTLKWIESALGHINAKNGESNEIGTFSHKGQKVYIWDLPEDPAVYDAIGNGATETLFQLDTKSMHPYVLSIKPQNITDIATIQALVRPGPLDYIDPKTNRNAAQEYAERRFGRSVSDIPILNQLLPETYGSLVYQEQITKIAIEVANMSTDQAEDVRIAMGKKQMKDLIALKPKFIAGASEKIGEATAAKIWDMMETFGGYGFNKSHAVGYSVITYACAFLKFHYPLEWWSAVLTHEDEDRINQDLWRFIKDMVLPPDINNSSNEMSPDYNTGKIRQRLTLLKGLGDKQALKIMEGRPYKDIKDFIKRGQCALSLTKKLAHVGVLDSLFEDGINIEKKIYLINKADMELEYEELIAKGKKPRALKDAEIDPEYLGLDAFTDYQIKKSILPNMRIDLHDIALKNYSEINNLGKFPFISMNGRDYPIYHGNILQKVDSNDVTKEATFCGVGYVTEISEFSFQNNTKKALKVFMDCSGYVSEKVIWPDRETGILTYPDNLKEGCVAMFLFNKRPNKPYTNIQDIKIIKKSLDKKKNKK